jgi:hypothetical protein
MLKNLLAVTSGLLAASNAAALITCSIQILLLHIGKERHGNGFVWRVHHLDNVQDNEKTAAHEDFAFWNLNSDVFGLF